MKPAHKKPFFPRLLGVYMDESASSYYRIKLPFNTLYEAGYPVAWGHISAFNDRALQNYDAVVVLRTGTGDPERIQKAIEDIQQEGKLVFLDYDDDILNIPDHNPGRLDSIDGAVAAISTANGIVVTNATLLAAMSVYAKRSVIVPNYVNPRLWPRHTRQDGNVITIGLTGSRSHIEDWRQVAEPLRIIKERYGPRVRISVDGWTPPYFPEEWCTPRWLPFHRYPYTVNQYDIGLCPLIEDHFNRCKSPIKAFEYAMGRVAVVGSPTQYGDVIRNRGIIARTEEQWVIGIAKYIDDPRRRFSDALSLNEYVASRWNVQNHVGHIAEAYRSLYLQCVLPLGRQPKVA
jgi:hypothetical protein